MNIGQRAKLKRTREQWAAVKPDAFLTGGVVQARNVIEMMRHDLLILYDEVDGRSALSASEHTQDGG